MVYSDKNVLPIIQLGDPLLRKKSQTLSKEFLLSDEIQDFIDQLIATMRQGHGVGIAAIQVARELQIFLMEVDNNPRYPDIPTLSLRVCVNPVLQIDDQRMCANYDGCLSVPDQRGLVMRHPAVTVRAWDRFGEDFCAAYYGLGAVIAQHEYDHLQRCLFVDRLESHENVYTWQEYDDQFSKEQQMLWADIQSEYGSIERIIDAPAS